MYNWQQKDWRQFTYDQQKIERYVALFSEKIGMSKGVLGVLSKEQRSETMIDALVLEALKTSEIEGEYISRKDLISSIKKNIGVSSADDSIKDLRAKGIAAMLVNVHDSYDSALSEESIFQWHQLLFSRKTTISVGAWRSHSEPMQVVSGSFGINLLLAPDDSGQPQIEFASLPKLIERLTHPRYPSKYIYIYIYIYMYV